MKQRDRFYKEGIYEILRFGIVGILATVIQYAFYFMFLKIGLSPTIAFTVSYGISWLCNFWLSARFTFRSKTNIKRGVGFASSHALNYLVQVLCLNLFIWTGIPEEFAPIPVYCISIPLSFILARFVFKSSKLS